MLGGGGVAALRFAEEGRGGDWVGRVLVFRLWFLFSNFEVGGWFFLGNIELSFGDASLSCFSSCGRLCFFHERASGW